MIADIFFTLSHNLSNTPATEFIAVLFGLLSVYFIMRENILGYPTGLVNVSIYVYLCFKAGLFANMGINIFYFMLSLWGWYQWSRKHGEDSSLKITALSLKGRLLTLAAILILTIILWLILRKLPESSSPFWDAFTTSIFIAAMTLQAYKKLECWALWIAGDVIAIPLFAFNGLVFTGLQYLGFLFLATTGLIAWSKNLNRHA